MFKVKNEGFHQFDFDVKLPNIIIHSSIITIKQNDQHLRNLARICGCHPGRKPTRYLILEVSQVYSSSKKHGGRKTLLETELIFKSTSIFVTVCRLLRPSQPAFLGPSFWFLGLFPFWAKGKPPTSSMYPSTVHSTQKTFRGRSNANNSIWQQKKNDLKQKQHHWKKKHAVCQRHLACPLPPFHQFFRINSFAVEGCRH